MKLRKLLAGTFALSLAAAVAACSGGGAVAGKPAGAAAKSDTLVIDMGFSGTTIQRNFNPFSPTATQGTMGFQYESLFSFNILKGGEFVPWLATKYDLTDGGKKLTIHLDPRANWSDGSKLTSEDVAFTLDFARKHDLGRFEYESVATPDPQTVVITFAKPAYTLVSSVGATRPVPKKIWADQDPAKWTNPDPVGSGPYKLTGFAAQQLTFTARDDYWKQKVPVRTLKMPVVSGGTGTLPKLLSGEIAWSGGAVPNVKKTYVDVNPKFHHAWYPTYGALFVYFNLTRKPFDNVHVRKAISLALDRQEIADIGNPGMFHPINATGLDQESMKDWIAPEYANLVQPKADLAAAMAELEQAGYKKEGDKVVGPDGEPFAFDIVEVSDFGDAVQRDKIIAQQLGKLGITVNVRPIPMAQHNAAKEKADFDVITGGAVYGGQTPYSFYYDILQSKNAGKWANFGHYKVKATDDLLAEVAGTADPAEVKSLINKLQKIMVDEVPMAPLINIGASAEYSTRDWEGWPDASNPYAIPAPWAGPPDMIQVVLGLRPAGTK
ncbi:ABC transporter substrate-binding protein [Nonomuraea africana]|uniref:Peptide/nickel transport system substrate-binding protein n=1 Tax=Nonomuraea africana TaxID=46171 RepID=A0ABR9KAC5_9ACTN|nr:ABC transporter substrate-binding protein [Nonomuraea africana]MBE1558963.1 peptide/nickel transport system substrate-binding protein [Nonomuraea africana]